MHRTPNDWRKTRARKLKNKSAYQILLINYNSSTCAMVHCQGKYKTGCTTHLLITLCKSIIPPLKVIDWPLCPQYCIAVSACSAIMSNATPIFKRRDMLKKHQKISVPMRVKVGFTTCIDCSCIIRRKDLVHLSL